MPRDLVEMAVVLGAAAGALPVVAVSVRWGPRVPIAMLVLIGAGAGAVTGLAVILLLTRLPSMPQLASLEPMSIVSLASGVLLGCGATLVVGGRLLKKFEPRDEMTFTEPPVYAPRQ